MNKYRLQYEFSIHAMHNLENPDLSNQENQKLYGICYRKHGHEYRIQILLEGQTLNPAGLLVDPQALEQIIESFTQKLNGQYLNDLYPCTSGEALSVYWYKELKALVENPLNSSSETQIPNITLSKLQIQETKKNWFAHS